MLRVPNEGTVCCVVRLLLYKALLFEAAGKDILVSVRGIFEVVAIVQDRMAVRTRIDEN